MLKKLLKFAIFAGAIIVLADILLRYVLKEKQKREKDFEDFMNEPIESIDEAPYEVEAPEI